MCMHSSPSPVGTASVNVHPRGQTAHGGSEGRVAQTRWFANQHKRPQVRCSVGGSMHPQAEGLSSSNHGGSEGRIPQTHWFTNQCMRPHVRHAP